MSYLSHLLTLTVLTLPAAALAQPGLEQQLSTIAAQTHGTVAMACSLPGSILRCDLNPHAHPPMFSVFKLPLALTVLHQVESGQLTLDQPIHFLPDDRILPTTYSPLQDKYPHANTDVPLSELLRLAVVLSDNVAADLLLRTIGGPATVNEYLHGLGITAFHMENNEHAMAPSGARDGNWIEPAAATAMLRKLADAPPLMPEHMAFLLGWMHDSATGAARIKGQLPPDTWVAHKTGTGGTHGGITQAINDIGLIRLPDGRTLALAIFVSDAKAPPKAIEAAIAGMATLVYDAALIATPH